MVDWYAELGELIEAQGRPWFSTSLQGALQPLFHYDYFLKVLFSKGKGVQVRRSDFPRRSMTLALRYYETETHIGDPIFRLYEAGLLDSGVYDMAQLMQQAAKLPSVNTSGLRHIVSDRDEEMGFRTIGWPQHLQETVIIAHVDETHMVAISLYNLGLETKLHTPADNLRTVFPAIEKLFHRHFELFPFETPDAIVETTSTPIDPSFVLQAFVAKDVKEFFKITHKTDLTEKEAAVFTKLLHGMTAPAAADQLCLSVHTIKTHRRNVYRRIGHTRLLELISQFHSYLSQ